MKLPNQVSESVKKRNPGLFTAASTDRPLGVENATRPRGADLSLNKPSGLSTDEERLNKTEKRYLAWARCMNWERVGIQDVTLKLAWDCRFTADFSLWDKNGLTLVDVKAFWKSRGKPGIKDDAKAKLQVAARLFPHIRFLIAYEEAGIWKHELIAP